MEILFILSGQFVYLLFTFRIVNLAVKDVIVDNFIY